MRSARFWVYKVSTCMQVECQPPGGMVMRVTEYSLSGEGFIRVVPTQVAGTGTLHSMELRASAGQVFALPTNITTCTH